MNNHWIVCKFGGTSVSTKENWDRIAQIIKNHKKNGFQILIIHSALTGITNLLESLIKNFDESESIINTIKKRHFELAAELSIDGELCLHDFFKELTQLATGIKLLNEASPKIQARILSYGELMATRLGDEYLRKNGINSHWVMQGNYCNP